MSDLVDGLTTTDVKTIGKSHTPTSTFHGTHPRETPNLTTLRSSGPGHEKIRLLLSYSALYVAALIDQRTPTNPADRPHGVRR